LNEKVVGLEAGQHTDYCRLAIIGVLCLVMIRGAPESNLNLARYPAVF